MSIQVMFENKLEFILLPANCQQTSAKSEKSQPKESKKVSQKTAKPSQQNSKLTNIQQLRRQSAKRLQKSQQKVSY